MTKDPCTVVSVARRSVPLLCFALGYDKSDMTRFTLSLTKKRKSIGKISCSALPRSDMTRSTLPLTKNKNQSKHQLLRLLREVCRVITDCCFSDGENSCSHITSCYCWVHQVEHESFYWVFFFSLFFSHLPGRNFCSMLNWQASIQRKMSKMWPLSMRGECEKIGDHPWEDLANSGYKLDMMHKFFFYHPFIFLATYFRPKLEFWKKNPPLPAPPPPWSSLLAINNLVNHFISELLILLFSEISPIKKGSLLPTWGAPLFPTQNHSSLKCLPLPLFKELRHLITILIDSNRGYGCSCSKCISNQKQEKESTSAI